MQNITVNTTAVKLPFGAADRPVLQNVSTGGDIYFGNSDQVTASNGLRLAPGVGYEFPSTLSQIADWDEVWVIASQAGVSLRVANVG
jgi:hypothetical protein